MLHIPHSRPVFGQAFIDQAERIISSNIVAQGDTTTALKVTLQQRLAQRQIVAVDSGTSALMLAIRGLAQKRMGLRVGIPAYACASLLFAVKAAGAMPVLMDCNENLCLNQDSAIATAKSLDILLLVHPFGMVEPLVTHHFPCPVIEDMAQSAGATCHGQAVGTCADVSIGSLYATKPWGGAYGGFVTTTNATLAANIQAMTDPDLANLDMDYVGHHQLSNLHAGMALQRLEQADAEQVSRQKLAAIYDTCFQDKAAQPIHTSPHTVSNAFRYIVRCDKPALPIMQQLHDMGIQAALPVSQPLHHNPTFQQDKDNAMHFQGADSAWQYCLSLPLLTDLNTQELAWMKQGIQTCFAS